MFALLNKVSGCQFSLSFFRPLNFLTRTANATIQGINEKCYTNDEENANAFVKRLSNVFKPSPIEINAEEQNILNYDISIKK